MLRSNRRATGRGRDVLALLLAVALALLDPRVVAADPSELTLEVDQATLTGQLNQLLSGRPLGQTPLGPASLDGIAVELRDGALTISGNARAGWLAVPVDLTASAVARAGRVQVRVESGHLGGLPIEGPIRTEIERTLQAQLAAALDRAGISVRSLTIADGRLVAVGASQEVEAAAPEASPSASPTPTRSPTAEPTIAPPPTLGPTVAPLPTLAPLPTFAPLPTVAPPPTLAPLPFALPSDTPTSTPEDTVTPATPAVPTETAAATATALPVSGP